MRDDDDHARAPSTSAARVKELATRGLEALRDGDRAAARAAFARLSLIAPSDALGPAGELVAGGPGRDAEHVALAERVVALTRDKPASWMYPANLPSGNGWLGFAARNLVRDGRVAAWHAVAERALAAGEPAALAAAGDALARATAIHGGDHAPALLATRARLALALGDDDGAYRLAHRVLLHEPAAAALAQIRDSAAYAAWLAARDLDGVDLAVLADRFEPRAFRALVSSLADAPATAIPAAGATDTELSAWRRLAAATTFARAAPRTVFAPDVPLAARASFLALAGAAAKSVHGPALVCAALAGCELLCGQDNDDERTYVAARAPAAGGVHAVYRYDPRQLVLAPSHASIAALLGELGGAPPPPRAPGALPPRHDPLVLSARASWLACAVVGVSRGSIAEDTEHAPGVGAFDAERGLLADEPHLALYWLLAHACLGNAADLRATLAAARAHASLAELCDALAGGEIRLGGIGPKFLSDLRAHGDARLFREPRPARPPATRAKPARATPAKPSPAAAPLLAELAAWFAARAAQPAEATRAAFTAEWLPRVMRLAAADRAIAVALVQRALPADD